MMTSEQVADGMDLRDDQVEAGAAPPAQARSRSTKKNGVVAERRAARSSARGAERARSALDAAIASRRPRSLRASGARRVVEAHRPVGLAADELAHLGIVASRISSLGRAVRDAPCPATTSGRRSRRSRSTPATSCETTSEVAPVVSLSVRIRLAATPIEIGSSPANGSSYMMQLGVERDRARQRDAPRHAARDLGDAQRRRAAQADGVQLHQHDVADHRLGEVGVLAQREGDVLEHRQVGEQRAELEQHAEAAAQRDTAAPGRCASTASPSKRTAPLLRRGARRRSGAAASSCRSPSRRGSP